MQIAWRRRERATWRRIESSERYEANPHELRLAAPRSLAIHLDELCSTFVQRSYSATGSKERSHFLNMDDLLDLDLSAPAAPSSSSSAAKGPQAAYGAGKSSFDYLSQMRTNTPSPLPSRSASPYSPSSTSTASANGRLAPAVVARPAPPAKASSGAGDDAFSSLFGASPSSAQGNAGGLSMAERLARESAAKIGGVGANGWTWTSLSPSSTGGSGSRSP